LEQKVSLHIKITTKAYETDYVMPCISGKRGRRKRRNVTRWVVYVCVCVRARVVPSLRCGFTSRSVREVWSCLCMTHMKQSPWDATITFP
jgi:hypothetical protein